LLFGVRSHLMVVRVRVEKVLSDGDAANVDPQVCLDVAQELRLHGNNLIGQGFSFRALHKYQRALDIIAKFAPQPRPFHPSQGFPPNFEPAGPESRPADARLHSLHCILLSNVAVCFLQLRKWNAAVKVCNELLEKQASPVDPQIRLKALVRRCKACAELGDWESALNDARAVKAESAEAWAGLGKVLRRCGELKEAHASRQRSV
jgi:tetratricopeptide (TPR) repeat protein